MNVIGVDLAWGETNGTGLCVISDGRVVDSGRQVSMDDIIAWLNPYVAEDCVVAIDAPLIVRNETGRRPCEQTISKCFGRHHASTHSSNLGNRWFRTGGRASELARRLELDTDPATVPRGSGRWAIEVYPHTALVVLFDLPLTLKYKAKRGRTMDGRRAEFARCFELLETLSGFIPSVDLLGTDRWPALKEEIRNAPT